MSNAFSGVGSKFRRWNSTAGEWQAVAEVKSISGPTMSREMIDVTNLDSTGGYREFIPSFRDGGTVTLSINFTYAGYSLLKQDFQSDTLINYEILLSDGTSIEFSGYVQDLPINVKFDDAVTSEITVKVSGLVTIDQNSGSSGSGI
jgi:predicted secreted protein